jgi:hypothetical protein
MRMSNYSVYKSEMSSTVRTVLTSLEIQSVTILASDLDDLAKNLSVHWAASGFFSKPPMAPTITSIIPISRSRFGLI